MRIVICGTGGHGFVIADAVMASDSFDLVGFVSKEGDGGETRTVAPLIGLDVNLPTLVGEYGIDGIVVAVGDNHVRASVLNRLRESLPSTVRFPTVVHPAATVGMEVSVGAGSVIFAGAVVGPGAQVGLGCIVNTRASLDHRGVMEDYSSLAPGVTTGGDVRIGEGSAVAMGATLLHGRSVGAWSVVGAGALVVDDVPDGVVAYGTPARVVRERAPGDRYL